jgi:hypothetical protein
MQRRTVYQAQEAYMKQPNIFVMVAAALAFGSGVAHSAVDCASVMRNLKAGASPEEVAKTMAVSLADVKDCQDRDQSKSADPGTALERGGTGDVAPPAGESEQTGSTPEI